MTEKLEKNNGTCPFCGEKTTAGINTIPFVVGEKTIVIKDVPRETCEECGEPYMIGSVVDRVQEILNDLEKLEVEVSVAR